MSLPYFVRNPSPKIKSKWLIVAPKSYRPFVEEATKWGGAFGFVTTKKNQDYSFTLITPPRVELNRPNVDLYYPLDVSKIFSQGLLSDYHIPFLTDTHHWITQHGEVIELDQLLRLIFTEGNTLLDIKRPIKTNPKI